MNIFQIERWFKKGLRRELTYGLMGPHGIGKTSFVKNRVTAIISEKYGIPLNRIHVITRCVSVMDPADLIGNFQEFGGRTYNCPPSWLPTCKEYDDEMSKLYAENGKTYARLTNYDDYYVLFFDECKRGNSVVQDALMELLLEHTIFGVKLHENTFVFCADNNNIEIYNGTKRDPAQASRIKEIMFAPSNAEYLADFASREKTGEIHPIIRKYLSENPSFIVLNEKTIEDLFVEGKKGPSPRDWTQLGTTLKEFSDNNDDITKSDFQFLNHVAASHIGTTYSDKFADYCKLQAAGNGNVEPDDIVNSYSKDVEKRLIKIFETDSTMAVTICDGILEFINDISLSDKQSSNIARFLGVCPPEAIVSFCKAWQANSKDAFEKWRCTPYRHNVLNNAIMNHKSKDGKKSAYDSWVDRFIAANNLTLQDLTDDTIILNN